MSSDQDQIVALELVPMPQIRLLMGIPADKFRPAMGALIPVPVATAVVHLPARTTPSPTPTSSPTSHHSVPHQGPNRWGDHTGSGYAGARTEQEAYRHSNYYGYND